MTKTARRATVGAAVMVAVMGWTSSAAAAESSPAVAGQQSLMAPDARVRSASPRVMPVIVEATAQSATFRGLVDQIGTTDGIVYVEEGQCGHRVHACLLIRITMAGPNRLLWILVDPQKSDRDLMASVGHELQHAVEVLSNRTVTTHARMFQMFTQICNRCAPGKLGARAPGGAFETNAAIRAGNAVRGELQNSATAAERRE